MSIRRVVPNINTARMDMSRAFYADFLGLEVAMDMEWIVTLASPDNATAQVSLVRDANAQRSNVSLTIEVADVDALYAKALALSVPILYPVTDEPWGVRRFHVADPNGVVVNLMMHIK